MSKAPQGKWQPHSPELERALGRFIISWSLIEAISEVGIAKLLKLSPLESSMVTGTMMFKAKTDLLLSLLVQDEKKYQTAISLVKKAKRLPDRNTIIHGIAGGRENVIWFNRRQNTGKFKSTIESYDLARLHAIGVKASKIAADLQRELEISATDFVEFFQAAHNAANNVSGS